MTIALIGATGNAGTRILNEALQRGHAVTAIVRDPSKLTAQPKLTLHMGDVKDEQKLRDSIAGASTVVSAFTPTRGTSDYTAEVTAGYRAIIGAARAANARLMVVGGAGSLRVHDGTYLVDTPQFPAEYKTEASAFRDILEMLKKESALNWTYMSPSAFFAPGTRTGKFRIGGEQLLADASGQSHISMEDFAIALIDEIENPLHLRQQFTVGY